MLSEGQAALMTLPQTYPELFSQAQVLELISSLRAELTGLGQQALANSLYGVTSIITILIYVILLPILIFFFLKDKRRILDWTHDLLPSDNPARDPGLARCRCADRQLHPRQVLGDPHRLVDLLPHLLAARPAVTPCCLGVLVGLSVC